MKKALLATTAVVLTAGMAAAEVKFSGDARFGLQYSSTGFPQGTTAFTGNTSKTILEKRLRLNLDASTTTDSGVTFGGRVRITSEEGVSNPAALAGNQVNANQSVNTIASGARVYAQYGGLTVAVGNILGAVETAPNFSRHAVRYTLTTLDYHSLGGFDAFASAGNGAEGIEVIYKQGPLQFHLSHSDADMTRQAGAARRTAAHLAYTFNGWTVAGVVQDSANNAEDFYGLTAGGKIQNFGVTFEAYNRHNANLKFVRLQGEAAFGETSVSGYVSKLTGNKASFGLGDRKSVV